MTICDNCKDLKSGTLRVHIKIDADEMPKEYGADEVKDLCRSCSDLLVKIAKNGRKK